MTKNDLEELRSTWSTLYSQTLPKLARAKDAAQPRWPITLDHCFARIILDNTVGNGKQQWDHVIKRPAVKNMDEQQLRDAIELGEQIKKGTVDLVKLDQESLKARGKADKKYPSSAGTKREREEGHKSSGLQDPASKKTKIEQKQSTISFSRRHRDDSTPTQAPEESTSSPQSQSHKSAANQALPNPNIPEFLSKIQNHGSLTPYRKRLYSTLLSVPAGRHTTYQAMATYLNSSARAVGNGMRNNPYAPDVPCHRVLASDGSIGGFHGSWGEEGKYASQKRDLLQSEGVRFDSKGRVKGPVFQDFQDLSTAKKSLTNDRG